MYYLLHINNVFYLA